LRPLLSRLFIVLFWMGLGATLAGAVVLEHRQLQIRAEIAAQPQTTRPTEVASVIERASGSERVSGGRSREQLKLPTRELPQAYTVKKDVSFGASPRLKLDVYAPTDPRTDGKTIVFLYGGYWNSGDKDSVAYVGEALASRGITTIIPNYRLFPEVRFPIFIEDCADATRWAALRYGTGKLFVMGHSAGAQIALMMAANTPYLADAGIDRMKLRGFIGLSGPYDFLPLTDKTLQETFGGSNDPAIEPITFAKAPLPPVLLIHGTGDTTVDADNSERLADAWRLAGAQVKLKLYSGVDHMAVLTAVADTLPIAAPTREDILAFIDSH
jgi:acetyl esterase/lipase